MHDLAGHKASRSSRDAGGLRVTGKMDANLEDSAPHAGCRPSKFKQTLPSLGRPYFKPRELQLTFEVNTSSANCLCNLHLMGGK